MAIDLKTIYRAGTIEQEESNLKAFGRKWYETFSKISQAWRDN